MRLSGPAIIVLVLIALMGGEFAWFRSRQAVVATATRQAPVVATGTSDKLAGPAPTAPSPTPDLRAAAVSTPAPSPSSETKAATPVPLATASTDAAGRPIEPSPRERVQRELAPQAKLDPSQVAKLDSKTVMPPKFDVVRVEPNGDTVVAGQGTPNSYVDLLVGGLVVARATTDETGHFAMLPPALKPGASALTLQQTDNGAPIASTQSIAVAVPEKNKSGVVVALAEPGLPTKILAAPPALAGEVPKLTAAGRSPGSGANDPVSPGGRTGPSAHRAAPIPAAPIPAAPIPTAASNTPAPLAIRAVEIENGTGFFASGEGTPGTKIRIYLNDSPVTTVVAGADRGWSVKIVKGLAGGHYNVRADTMGEGTQVTSRVEVPFDVPVAMAAMPQAAPAPDAVSRQGASPTPQSGAIADRAQPPKAGAKVGDTTGPASVQETAPPPPSAVVVAEIKTTIVATGDSLWDISRIRLGQGRRYTRIYAANLRQIRDPKLIYPGQILVLPKGED